MRVFTCPRTHRWRAQNWAQSINAINSICSSPDADFAESLSGRGFCGAERGTRTPTTLSGLRILSPLRLPVPPSRRGRTTTYRVVRDQGLPVSKNMVQATLWRGSLLSLA